MGFIQYTIAYKDNKPVLVLDTKYTEIKRENEKPTLPSEMLRQIYTYAKYYTLKCNYKIKSVLIFPKSKKYSDFNDNPIIGEATFFDNEIKLYVLTYNLEKLIEGDEIDEEFINYIKKLTENRGEGLEWK